MEQLVQPFSSFGSFVKHNMKEGRPARLYSAEICTYDLRRWVLVANINGPYAGSGTDIEDAAGLSAERSLEKLAAHRQSDHTVRKVESIKFALVDSISLCSSSNETSLVHRHWA